MKTLLIKQKLTGRTKEEKLQKVDGDYFRKYVLHYGIILVDNSRSDETGHYRGTESYINGMVAEIEMFNGKVKAWGLTVDDNDIRRINMRLERENSDLRLIK